MIEPLTTEPTEKHTHFLDFLRDRIAQGQLRADDVLATVLPLLEQTLEAHEHELVAPLSGVDALEVDYARIWFENSKAIAPRLELARLRALDHQRPASIDVVGETHVEQELDSGSRSVSSVVAVEQPAYLPNYVAWEHDIGHHDPLTDIYSLGMILASFAFGLDFTDPDDLDLFVANRANLFRLNDRMSPVVVKVIHRMTALRRHDRAQDLDSLIHVLRNYREQAVTPSLDYNQIEGFKDAEVTGRRALIQARLRERLFEFSRRNRLLYFKNTLSALNLTVTSVPTLLDYKNIRSDELLTWQGGVKDTLSAGKRLNISRYVRVEDAPYAPRVLDKIRSQARRDRKEYGFAQLRLVLCFFRWHNLKEAPEERIHSPLLLLPVELTKKKGVRDTYHLEPHTTEAEVNPVLRHHLSNLYGLELPESIDLSKTDVDAFFTILEERIRASEPGITLNKITKPKIELIYRRARRRLDQYRKRSRMSGRGVRKYGTLDYSYRRDNPQPLGLKLFLNRVRPAQSPFADVFHDKPMPRTVEMMLESDTTTAPPEKKKEFYHLKEGSDANPYEWDFDLCSITLGNFNYRKMTLVRDYRRLMEEDRPNRPFDDIFSLDPKALEDTDPPEPTVAEQYSIVDADRTQAASVVRSRSGHSYIIQGPPGTGKSQTITNLIADFVAHDKRVLFVCQKRAAIDVVFHRLKQKGLDELACLIHDSQEDKKSFIMDLKDVYEGTLAEKNQFPALDRERKKITKAIQKELDTLSRYADWMRSEPDTVSDTVRNLIVRLIELPSVADRFDVVALERLPHYCEWHRFSREIHALSERLTECGQDPRFANSPLRLVRRDILGDESPLATIATHVESALSQLAVIDTQLAAAELTAEETDTFEEVAAILDLVRTLKPLNDVGLLRTLDETSADHARFENAVTAINAKKRDLAAAADKNDLWRTKLPPRDTQDALDLASRVEGSFLAFLKPSWWRLKKLMRTHYDFESATTIRTWTRVLTELQEEHDAQAAVDRELQVAADQFKVGDFDDTSTLRDTLRASLVSLGPSARAFHDSVTRDDTGPTLVKALEETRTVFATLKESLEQVLSGYADLPLPALAEQLRGIQATLEHLPDLMPVLVDLVDLPAALDHTLRSEPLLPDELEAATAHKTFAQLQREQRELATLNADTLDKHIGRLHKNYRKWLDVNARWIVARLRDHFRDRVHQLDNPATDLTAGQKEFKKHYQKGRRELEHEFGKSMRYKSIRDLASDESGAVVRDLKPIWLMSPLSVSDTIPLLENEFDVVIFDEASQVPVEEAIPALYRATQTIVVGDEMQLPPTSFFAASATDEEAILIEEEEGEVIEYELDADSFLTQSARNLPSTLLGWHYRSRYEALIGFSNAAFYQGRLRTIPDRRLRDRRYDPIVVESPEDGFDHWPLILERSVSFHYLENSVYEKRRNADEAAYIAQLVHGLLTSETRKTIGIVAFSEAQQSEIESALDALAEEDSEFRNRLDEEEEREDDDQFVGLFVKNLENVQGDEREIIILSVCYGPNADGKTRMNFGPINKNGGEKRLNVIFSRSKERMVVVSSMRHTTITNDYNDGARCLKNYLLYSEAVSTGDWPTANRVSRELAPDADGVGEAPPEDPVVSAIATELTSRGWEVAPQVGQSSFRCDLGVRAADDPEFRLGIVVDSDRHYQNPSALESFYLRPGILKVFGWNVVFVLSSDWYQDRDRVLAHIESSLRGEKRPPSTVVKSVKEASVAEEALPPETETPDDPEEAPDTTARRFVYQRGSSDKYWEVWSEGTEMIVHFGRIGSQGQTRRKDLGSPEALEAELERTIASKVRKGYTEEQ